MTRPYSPAQRRHYASEVARHITRTRRYLTDCTTAMRDGHPAAALAAAQYARESTTEAIDYLLLLTTDSKETTQ